MNFKAQAERDLEAVFHNPSEHADVVEFWYDGNRYSMPIILDHAGAQDRKKPSMDNVDGIILVDLVMYVSLLDLKVTPKKGQRVEIGDDVYTIRKVEIEAGEIVLRLEMLDE